MESNLKILSPEVVMEPLLALLDEVTAIPLVITGNSMTPFLVHQRDTVYLSKVDFQLKRGDMVLYQRNNGRYVLHRIMRIDGNVYTMLGDAQIQPETGICKDQVRAVVTAVRRKGVLLQKGSFWWGFFERVWIRIVPVRPVIRNVYSFIRQLVCRKELI